MNLYKRTAIAAGLFIRLATFESDGDEATGDGLGVAFCTPGLSFSGGAGVADFDSGLLAGLLMDELEATATLA